MGDDFTERGIILCSFCGKTRKEVKKIITGISVMSNICNECVDLCHNILSVEVQKEEEIEQKIAEDNFYQLPTPQEITNLLDEIVIGQEKAKKILSVAVYNHYKRNSNITVSEIPTKIKKSNILLVGPTGSGKTLLAQSLAEILNVPFAIADATSLTEAGYVGEDVEGILTKLLVSAGGSINDAQKGIVYIDEIDKIALRAGRQSASRDISGEGVQQALLKVIEGTIANIPKPGKSKINKETIPIDTKNILFICGGAFVGLENIIKDRDIGVKKLGFGTQSERAAYEKEEETLGETLAKLRSGDLQKFGIIPELIGRIPISATLHELDVDTLIKILTDPKDSLINQYKKIFYIDGAELVFTKGALEEIAAQAIKENTGARGLRAILEEILLQPMYDTPTNKNIIQVIINKRTIQKKEKAKYVLDTHHIIDAGSLK